MKDILPQEQTPNDSETTVSAIDDKEDHVAELSRRHYYQPGNQVDNDTSHTYRPDITSETHRLFPEIEKQKYKISENDIHNEVCIDEPYHFLIDIQQGAECHQGIDAGHAVDSVHEIIHIEDADTYENDYQRLPPINIKYIQLIKYHREADNLEQKAYFRVNRLDVIAEADHRDDCDSEEEPQLPHAGS